MTTLCLKGLSKVRNSSEYLQGITFSDECLVHINEAANKHNARVRVLRYSHAVKELLATSENVIF